MPYDGEVTVQVYRKDLYDAKGLKPADDLETFVKNAAALNAPNDRIWGTALRRGFAKRSAELGPLEIAAGGQSSDTEAISS